VQKQTLRDANREVTRLAAIADRLDWQLPEPSAEPEMRAETEAPPIQAADIAHWQTEAQVQATAGGRQFRPRPVTQFLFRDLARSTTTDPREGSTNVAVNEPRSRVIPLPSMAIEPQQAVSPRRISITLYTVSTSGINGKWHMSYQSTRLSYWRLRTLLGGINGGKCLYAT
jgi:hypothetical protein